MTENHCRTTTSIDQAEIIPFPFSHQVEEALSQDFNPHDLGIDPLKNMAIEMAAFCKSEMIKAGIETKPYSDFLHKVHDLVVDFQAKEVIR